MHSIHGFTIVFDMALDHEIHHITDTDEHARDFLFQGGILKTSMSFPSCSTNMTLVACSASKSPDLFPNCYCLIELLLNCVLELLSI